MRERKKATRRPTRRMETRRPSTGWSAPQKVNETVAIEDELILNEGDSFQIKTTRKAMSAPKRTRKVEKKTEPKEETRKPKVRKRVQESKDSYQIYVRSLEDYNSGRGIGEWIDIEGMDADEIGDAIEEYLEGRREKTGGAHEEWAIHDYEGIDPSLFGEYPSIEELGAFMEALDKVQDADAFMVFMEYMGSPRNAREIEEHADAFEDAFAGHWDSEEEYAYGYIEDTGLLDSLPENLRYYFDYQSFARDIFISDMWSAPADGGGIYAFNNY